MKSDILESRAPAMFNAFVALVLCAGLMIPVGAAPQSAWADEPVEPHSFGTLSIDSDDATGEDENVIELEVGETASIAVDPYQHVQYKGCGKDGCPDDCEAEHGVECFVDNLGCKCDVNPDLRTAAVEASTSDEGIVSVGEATLDETGGTLSATEEDLGKTARGIVQITGEQAGTATVTVKASGLWLWGDAERTYTVKVGSDEPSDQPSFDDLESDHSYASNTDKEWTYTWEDAAEFGMAVTFDESTEVENSWDFIYLYDGDGNELGKYTGKELASQTVYVPQSDTVKIRLVSDSSGEKWGFKVTDIEALECNDLGVVGKMAPISAQFMTDGTACPDPVVTYGAKTLKKGEDYTVSYEGNDRVGEATVTVTGAGIYEGSLSRTFRVVDGENLADGAVVAADQQILLRQTADTGATQVRLEQGTEEWTQAVTGVSVAPIEDGVAGEAVELSADQYEVGTGRILFNRTAESPVFYVEAGVDPVEVKGRWSTNVYPQSRQYEITVTADGYKDVVGTATFYTGTANEFQIIIDEDGDANTTDDRTVVGSYDVEDIKAMSEFANGSSQCGMTGFRTFSGTGVPLKTLLDQAGVEVGPTDAFLLDTSDHYGNHFTYEDMFGTPRYFLQSIYDDQEMKDAYAELVKSDDEAGSLDELRRLLADKALEDNSTVEPMLSVNYEETLISGDEVASAQLPTEENVKPNELVNYENRFRFIYGIKLQSDSTATVSFDSNGGSEVASQTVKAAPMTSTENTTYKSSYWGNSLVIYRNAVAPYDPAPADCATAPQAPTRDGYLFAGWYTDKDCTDGNEFDFNGAVDGDTVLYAKWVKVDEIGQGIEFPEGAETVSTGMGRYPAGKVDFGLGISDEALAAYQGIVPDASKKDLMQAWIDSLTEVSVDGVKLEGKAFDEWKDQLTNAKDDAGKLNYYALSATSRGASLSLPVALFDTDAETSTKTVTFESSLFGTVSGDVTYRSLAATDVVVRVLDAQGNVQSSKVLTADDLSKLPVQRHYKTSADCGMAGLRTYDSEGVLLTDVLAAAGANFGPGMTLKVRVNDMLDSNGGADTTEAGYWENSTMTYENLLGMARYYYPAAWDDTPRDELGGQSIADMLAQDKGAWKTGENAATLAALIGQSKQEVQPLLAWSWTESVNAMGGTDPEGNEGYDGYSSESRYRFLFGMQAGEDGSIVDDNTTFANTYGVFGLDVVLGEGASVDPENPDDPENPVNPDDPENPVNPQDPTDPTKPADPVNPTDPDAVGAVAPAANGNDGNGDAGNGAAQQTAASTGTKALSQTGDSLPVAPIACVAVAALALLALATFARRRSEAHDGPHMRR